MWKSILLLSLMPLLTIAQPRGSVRAHGEASISVRPDQARVGVAIETQGATAADATAANATRAQAVIDQLTRLLNVSGTIKTVSFLVNPVVAPGTPQTIVGFRAINSLEVTTSDLTLVGRIVDTAVSAGATRVDSLRVGLRDEDPVRLQALRAAGQKAKAKAEAIAAGLGARLGAIINADEGFSARPVIDSRSALAATTTPVLTGTLDVTGTVTVEYELLP